MCSQTEVYVCVVFQVASAASHSAASWTVTCQAPLSMGILQARILESPPLGDLLAQGLNPCLLCLLHWQAGSLPLAHLGSPSNRSVHTKSLQSCLTLFFFLILIGG